jgi:hypothetical protein
MLLLPILAKSDGKKMREFCFDHKQHLALTCLLVAAIREIAIHDKRRRPGTCSSASMNSRIFVRGPRWWRDKVLLAFHRLAAVRKIVLCNVGLSEAHRSNVILDLQKSCDQIIPTILVADSALQL